MTSAPAHLCVTCVLVFSSFLALVSAAFAIIIGNHELFPRAPRKPPYWITPFNLLICLAFILSVAGLSLMTYRLPAFLSFP